MYNIKFKAILKSGQTFECIEEMPQETFMQVVNTCKVSMQNSRSGVLFFSDCVIRLDDVSVIEWEVLSESKTEES